jgi:hypothetical protein
MAPYGDRIVSRLDIPLGMRQTTVGSDGMDDIGNATAMGAALLAVHGAEPTFATTLGVRLADKSGDRFYPVFSAGTIVDFKPKVEKFFVTDTSSGVARLLVCDQDDPNIEPGGRLLRVVAVPIHPEENWVDVTFSMDRHLMLRVKASGRKETFRGEPTWVQHLNLGFRMPSS